MKNYIFLFILIILTSCFKVPDQLVMPGWDSEFNLPLTNRSYTLGEIINSDDNVKIDTLNGNDKFTITTDSMNYSFGIGDYLKSRLDQGFTNLEMNLQNNEASLEIQLTNGIELDSANFSEGELVIDIINTGNTIIEYEVTLPDLYRSDGKNFKFKSSIPGNGRSSSNLDLSGCYYSSYQNIDKSKLRVKGKVISGSGVNLIKLNISVRNSNFKYISGKLPKMDIAQINKDFELPITDAIQKFRDKLELYNSILTIEAQYKTTLSKPFEILVKNIKVIGKRNDGSTINLTDGNGDENLGEIFISKNKSIRTFSNANSNLTEFLSFLPDSVYIRADVTVNPDGKRGEASSSDSVLLYINIELTGDMSFNNVAYSDSVNLQLTSDDRKTIRNGREAILYLELTNAIPLSVDFDIVFADSSGNALFNKKAFIDASEVDGNGRTSVPSQNISQIKIDSTEIQKFADCEKVVYNLLLSTSGNGKKVSLHPSDWLKLITYFKLKYHVEFDK
ncbi:MAG: hypothetical protein HZB41_14760 [Ignavibacteriae bacterium]|nr:hypothetical protein [Ignavibacteriota bacterium]